jgi:NADH-quinone oxidoreductase subunit F
MLQRIESGEATPMDLDIMAGVQTQIIGHCLCVLGDAMAMPIGSMIEKLRDELETEIQAARERFGAGALEDVIPIGVADEELDGSGAAHSSEAGGRAGGKPEGPMPVH